MDHLELGTSDHTDPLSKKVAQLVERAAAKARERPQGTIQCAKVVVQLPMWPESARGVPNGFLRSALFGAIKKGPRRYVEREHIYSLENIRIIYTGARLDQSDLDLWEQVLHIARVQALGDECHVTAYQLLKLLGITDTGKNRTTLDRRLSRLKATGVDVQVGHYGYEGSLIDDVYRDINTQKYIIRLNPKLRSLFEKDQWTAIDWNIRRALDGQQLAKWLHGFYATHAKPFRLTVAKLHALCGSENADLHGFKRDMRAAFNAISTACAAHGQKFYAEIRGDLVHVEKTPTGTQRRHLAKKSTNRPTQQI